MHIGLVGGIGVAATLAYYQRLTAAVAAQGAEALALTIVHGDIHELIRNNLADRRAEQARAFLPLVERLKAAGCDCGALTSLGGHFCFDELAALSPLPLVSALAPLDTYFSGRGIRRIGLLGTRAVMRDTALWEARPHRGAGARRRDRADRPDLSGCGGGRRVFAGASGAVSRCGTTAGGGGRGGDRAGGNRPQSGVRRAKPGL